MMATFHGLGPCCFVRHGLCERVWRGGFAYTCVRVELDGLLGFDAANDGLN